MTVGDYLKLCKDFEIPLKKTDQQEVFRQKSLRSGHKVDFVVFQEILKEIFYVKESLDELELRRKEIKILSESNLTWSMEKKQEVLAHVEAIKNGSRDASRDQIYLYLAHDYLKTFDNEYI